MKTKHNFRNPAGTVEKAKGALSFFIAPFHAHFVILRFHPAFIACRLRPVRSSPIPCQPFFAPPREANGATERAIGRFFGKNIEKSRQIVKIAVERRENRTIIMVDRFSLDPPKMKAMAKRFARQREAISMDVRNKPFSPSGTRPRLLSSPNPRQSPQESTE